MNVPCILCIVFFYFNQQRTLYILLQQCLYYNHSYMFRYLSIILREFQSRISLKLRSVYIIKIL
jgi:hypothetical protein